jgi:hypothetical protein
MRFKNKILIFLFSMSALLIQSAESEQNSLNLGSNGSSGSLNKDRIMQIAYERNPRIAAARYKLESANCNFKLFEREYSQFIPFKMESRIRGEGDRINETVTGDVSAGVEKNFFDGSSIDFNVGSEAVSISGMRENAHFVRTNVEFPLFSSNKKLSRIIDRTYEENELYNAQLSYIEHIREIVLRSLEMYYDLISRTQILDAIWRHEAILSDVLKQSYLEGRPMEKQQLQNEQNTLHSEIDNWIIQVNSLKLELKTQLHVDNLDDFIIETIPLDFDSTRYYGQEYITNSYESVLAKALQNDNEIKIMIKTMQAAEEKKTLVKRGKWDILFSGEMRYNYNTESDLAGHKDYSSVGAGLALRRFDEKTLEYSRLKAEADILSIQAQIQSRQTDVASQIKRDQEEAKSNKMIFCANSQNVDSRWSTFQDKLTNYLIGKETVDNLIIAFRSHLTSEIDRFWTYNHYLDNIRNLDHLCGVYFSRLGIEVK